MSTNKISDIIALEKVNFKGLKTLDLSYNKISDISEFDNFKLYDLEKLNIGKNKINSFACSSLLLKLSYKIKSFEYYDD